MKDSAFDSSGFLKRGLLISGPVFQIDNSFMRYLGLCVPLLVAMSMVAKPTVSRIRVWFRIHLGILVFEGVVWLVILYRYLVGYASLEYAVLFNFGISTLLMLSVVIVLYKDLERVDNDRHKRALNQEDIASQG